MWAELEGQAGRVPHGGQRCSLTGVIVVQPDAEAAALAPLALRLWQRRWVCGGGAIRACDGSASRVLGLVLQPLSRRGLVAWLLLLALGSGWCGCRSCRCLRLRPGLLVLLLPPPLGSGRDVGGRARPHRVRVGRHFQLALAGWLLASGRGWRLLLPLLLPPLALAALLLRPPAHSGGHVGSLLLVELCAGGAEALGAQPGLGARVAVPLPL